MDYHADAAECQSEAAVKDYMLPIRLLFPDMQADAADGIGIRLPVMLRL